MALRFSMIQTFEGRGTKWWADEAHHEFCVHHSIRHSNKHLVSRGHDLHPGNILPRVPRPSSSCNEIRNFIGYCATLTCRVVAVQASVGRLTMRGLSHRSAAHRTAPTWPSAREATSTSPGSPVSRTGSRTTGENMEEPLP